MTVPIGGFWVKTDTYLEQPEVTYTKELLLLTEGFKGGEAFSASFSTLAAVNGLNHPGLRDAVVKASQSFTVRKAVFFDPLVEAVGCCRFSVHAKPPRGRGVSAATA